MNERRLAYYISNEEIYQYYFGDFTLTDKYNSPFRHDPRASFMFKNVGTYENPYIIWTDFGMSYEHKRNGVGFVSVLFGISREEAVERIYKELVLSKKKIKKPKLKLQRTVNNFIVYPKKYEDFELNYWKQLYFDKDFLKRFEIEALDTWEMNGSILWESYKDNPTFIYKFADDYSKYKLYRPYGRYGDKFKGIKNGDVIEGYKQLPKTGNILFINSSLKDTIVFYKMGCPSINPPSESNIFPIIKKYNELSSRFKRIIILFDNDKAGKINAFKLQKYTNWEILFLPNYKGIKDPSDWVMKTKSYFGLINYLKIKL